MTWRERIVAARERGWFTADEVALARSWETCAVGEQHAMLPGVVIYHHIFHNDFAWRIGGPTPGEPLNDLGGDFHLAVKQNTFDLADSILDRIEDRVLQLKREAQ